MDIEKREIAFKIATKSLEVLGLNVSAETLWVLVEAIQPILETAQQSAQADGDYCTCKPYPHEVIRDGVWLCSYCYRPRR